MSPRRSALTVLALSALTLPFAPAAVAAPGDTPIPPARAIAEFCVNPTASQFTDVVASGDDNASELALAVRCLATADVAAGGAGGRPATQYAPDLSVTRAQMASFVARMLDAASVREVEEPAVQELPAPAAANPFPADVAADDVHLPNIKRLAQVGVVQGLSADRYGPAEPVTRAQMASFLNRAVAYAEGGTVAEAGSDDNGFVATDAEYYVDALPEVHRANINGITSVGISRGTGAKAYGSAGSVTRTQMARFLARTLATLNSPAGEQRILPLLDVLSASFPDAGRDDATVGVTPGPLAATPATPLNSRTYTATGLVRGVEYRVTLVTASQITRATEGSNGVRFAVGQPANGGNGFLVNTGAPVSRIVSVNGETPENNTAAGTGTTPNDPAAATAVAEAQEDGSLSLVVRSSGAEEVVPVIYVNGAGDQSSYATGGGADHRLEIDAQGRPIERFGLAGATTFGP